MKIKRKGKKVHPSPPQATATHPHPPPSVTQDSLSVLNLLPAAIFALVAALSFQDREVLAYMITRSLKTTTTASINSSSPSVVQDELKLKLKKTYFHKSPVFDCECFECYTSFWFRWDSSANREVIHQAIEAFEEHLASGELEMKRNRRGKKKDKLPLPPSVQMNKIEHPHPDIENEETAPEQLDKRVVEGTPKTMVVEEQADAAVLMSAAAAAAGGSKGFARKVLPDVLGVFNSRLWNLWGPNV